MIHRTRIKICGLTREQDVLAAVAAGADAVGLNFHPGSSRYVTPERAAQLMAVVPPYVMTVGLFVNVEPEHIAAVVEKVPLAMLQFHGDESMEQCRAGAQRVNRPFMRALRVKPDAAAADLLEYEARYRAAGPLFAGLLMDAWTEQFGGAGKVFDWSVIPEELAPRVVLSGGLSVRNVTDAVLRVRPYAVDVASGVEQEKGIKDAAKIREFIEGVRAADAVVQTNQRIPTP